MTEKPTHQQLDELRRPSKEPRGPDEHRVWPFRGCASRARKDPWLPAQSSASLRASGAGCA
jgi:hypothetical protein